MNSAQDHASLGPQRLSYRAREARLKFWRVTIITSFFAVLFGGSLLAGAATVIGKMQNQSHAAAAARYRTGIISRPMLDGVFCHTLVLDNNSGQAVEDKVEHCDADSNSPARARKTEFVWGAQR
jgi:hypothetical protein